MKQKLNIFWFRRDLRLHDNHALFRALKSGLPVLPVFIFDTNILSKLRNKSDARVTFIYKRLAYLKTELEQLGSSLYIIHTTPSKAFKQLLITYQVVEVFANKDYEPYGRDRDIMVAEQLHLNGIALNLYNDHVIFEPGIIIKADGKPYTVFTPYAKMWLRKFGKLEDDSKLSENYHSNFIKIAAFDFPAIHTFGFSESCITISKPEIMKQQVLDYKKYRDIPSVSGTSKLGVHLRFGTLSIRTLTHFANQFSETFLTQLIWRNFFVDILWHFPRVEHSSFKPAYDFIQWRNHEREFELWCQGKTGYPLVDAGMRELNATGFMHNRVRMLVASFLCKHLLIDWRWGEAYFAEKLLDYELASNNGNWQWAAGCGCDAAPYFRIFNPELQQKKFDPHLEYVNKWIPELNTKRYPMPVVDHKLARERVLKVYRKAIRGTR